MIITPGFVRCVGAQASRRMLNDGETKESWREKLKGMTEGELRLHCKKYIWLSAYANNNATSDYHFLCDAGYDECLRRARLDIYERAYNETT
jgi:hypothetical protein